MLAPPKRDETGNVGQVIQLTVNTQGSDKYASFHGSIVVLPRGAAKPQVYYWGGSTCPAQTFSDPQVALLAQALDNRTATDLEPIYRPARGTESHRCLVAFSLIAAGLPKVQRPPTVDDPSDD